jgi:hypothetical protein
MVFFSMERTWMQSNVLQGEDMVIRDVGFRLSVSCASTGVSCGHIEFCYDPNIDKVSEVRINGEFVEPQDAFAQMVWKLYPRHILYREACQALDGSKNDKLG